MSGKIYSLTESGDHSAWFIEGDGRIEMTSDGVLRLITIDTGLVWPKTPPCCTLWLQKKLPDEYLIEYDFAIENGTGASIVFIDAQGVKEADIFSWSRSGGWEGYADLGLMRMYTMSFGRVDLPGVNMRKLWAPDGDKETSPIISSNPIDPCTRKDHYYHHRIEKSGSHILMTVDGEVIHDYSDDGVYGPPLHGGWFAIRNFRYARTTRWKNIVVTALS